MSAKKKTKLAKKHLDLRTNVSIIRHKHGWCDGDIKGVITNVGFRSGGASFYTVTDHAGVDYFVRSKRDLIVLN